MSTHSSHEQQENSMHMQMHIQEILKNFWELEQKKLRYHHREE